MIITVTGESSASLAPEVATCHFRLGFESAELAEAVQRATQLANEMSAAFAALRASAPSPVTETVLLPLATRSWRPWHREGKQLPLRHGATARASATFTDFDAMSAFIGSLARRQGVTVAGVDWDLTEERRRAETATVLALAVTRARERATVLAAAAGADSVRFVELSDERLDGPAQPAPHAAMMRGAGAESGNGDDAIDLAPEDITISAQVHARFTTD